MRKIMLVEDDAITAMHTNKILEDAGYLAQEFIPTGEEAVKAVEKVQPDLILMDIMLDGEIDGIETVKIIHSNYDIPVIYLTANADAATVERARETEPYGYLNKPVGKRDLLTNIDSAIYRHTSENKIRESEERFRTIFNAVNDAIFIHDCNTGKIFDVNETACRLFGYSCEEILSLEVEILSSGDAPYSQKDAENWMEKTLAEGPQLFDWLSRDRSGRLFWVEVNMNRARIGNDDRIIVTLRDIDERKRAQDELINEKKLTDAVIDSIPGMFYLHDEMGTLLRWNTLAEEISGYSYEELDGMNALDFHYPAEHDEVHAAYQKVFNEGYMALELFFKIKSGEQLPYYFTGRRLDLDEKKYLVGVGIDFSEIKAARERIDRLNRELLKVQEENKQRIAGDLHDSVVQTMMAAKINFQEFKDDTAGCEDRFDLGIEFLDRAMEELREIYTDLYPSILRDIGLEAAIRWYTKKHLEVNGIKSVLAVKLKSEIPDDTKTQLYRIIQEVFSNIIKHSGADSVKVSFLYEDEDNFKLTVDDNGRGFENLNGKHNGHGLFSIEQRASLMEGTLTIKSVPDEGTSISIVRGMV